MLARRYGVTSGVISSIRLGKTWKHVSGKVFATSGPNPVKKLSSVDIPVIRQMFLDGFKFQCTNNNVWLTQHVPVKYINVKN